MKHSLSIMVLWCISTANFADYDPHQIGAAASFVRAHLHDSQCGFDPPLLSDEISLEQCQTQAMLHFMPGWIPKNPSRVWMGAVCSVYKPEPFDIHPMPQSARGG